MLTRSSVMLHLDKGGAAVFAFPHKIRVEAAIEVLLAVSPKKGPLSTPTAVIHASDPSGRPAHRFLVAALAVSRARRPGASIR